MGKWGKKKRKIIIRLIKTSLKQQEWRTDESLNKQVNNNIRLLWDSYGLKTPHNMGCWFSVWRSKSKTCIYIYITKTKKKAHSHTHVHKTPSPLPTHKFQKDIWTGRAVRDAEVSRWEKCIWELCQSLRDTALSTRGSHSTTCNSATAE